MKAMHFLKDRLLLAGIFTVALAGTARAALVGCWEFDESGYLEKASCGNDLVISGSFPTWAATITYGGQTLAGTVTTRGGAASNMLATHGIGANGGGSKTNEYTLVFDVRRPNVTAWRSFYQTNLANSGDAEYFVRGGGGVANSLGRASNPGYTTYSLPADTWVRLVISAKLGSAPDAHYRTFLVDGTGTVTNQTNHSLPALDGDYALDPAQVLLFADNTSDNQPLTLGSVAIFDQAIATVGAVEALGGPGAPLMPVPPPGNEPPSITSFDVPSIGHAGVPVDTEFVATDPDDDDVQIQLDWGDGQLSAWAPLYASPSAATPSHIYAAAGNYPVRARTRDAYLTTSEWQDISNVAINPPSGVPADLAGLWEFDDFGDPGKATLGTNLVIVGTAPSWAASLTDGQASPNTLGGVITTVGGAANRLVATHGIGVNGGGTKTNQYSLVFDVLLPSSGQWRAFYQTAMTNTTEAEYFVRASDSAFGRATVGYTSSVATNRWQRLVISVDLSSGGSYKAYLDGVLFRTHSKPALDSDYALDPSQVLFFADNNGENQPLAIGMAAIFSKALNAGEAASLGGPGISLITDPANLPPVVTTGSAGSATADIDDETAYTFAGTDPDTDNIQIQADWGDGMLSSWSGFTASGSSAVLSHAWTIPGVFTIRARARDAQGSFSPWITVQTVEVTGIPVVDFATPPYLQNMGTDHMVVMFETAQDLPLKVEYGTSTAYGTNVTTSRVASGGGTWFHRAFITGLTAGTVHHYRVTTEAGDPLTVDATFRTAPTVEEDFKFSVFADIQTHNNGAWEANPWQPALAMLEHARLSGPSFALGCGDHAQSGSNYANVRNSHLDRLARVLGTQVPFFIAWGNHDGGATTTLRLSADMPTRFRPGLTPGHGNYSFSYSGVFFVCFDYFYYHDEITNGWLEEQLASPEAQNARFRIVAIHVPPYCERYSDGSATLRNTLVPLLEQYDVDICFSGHIHEYERGQLNGVNYVITGGGSYLDHNTSIFTDWPHMTVGGAQNVPGMWAQQSSNGVLGEPQPIISGLFNEYCEVTVRGDYLRLDCHAFNADGSYIGVLDSFEIGEDPELDRDGDSMGDAWERANGLDPNDPNDSMLDSDGDGVCNLHECIAGTSANDPLSVFRATTSVTGGNVSITWSSVLGKRYHVQMSSDLVSWKTLEREGRPLVIEASPGSSTTYALPDSPSDRCFLRVEVVR